MINSVKQPLLAAVASRFPSFSRHIQVWPPERWHDLDVTTTTYVASVVSSTLLFELASVGGLLAYENHSFIPALLIYLHRHTPFRVCTFLYEGKKKASVSQSRFFHIGGKRSRETSRQGAFFRVRWQCINQEGRKRGVERKLCVCFFLLYLISPRE